MKIKITKENTEYQYKGYKKDEIWVVVFDFEPHYIAYKEGVYASKTKAVKKTDCEIIEP